MDIESKEFKRLIREIARRNNVEPDIALNVFVSQFECARRSMKRMDIGRCYYPYILLPYFLTFKVLPGRIRRFSNRLKNKEKDVYSKEGDTDN